MINSKNFQHCILIVSILVVFTDCGGPVTVSPTYLLTDSSKRIHVYTFDRRVITFSPGEYTVIDYKDSAVVQGRVVVRLQGKQIEREFSGRINFRDITEIGFHHSASAWVTTPLYVFVALFFALVVFLSQVRFST